MSPGPRLELRGELRLLPLPQLLLNLKLLTLPSLELEMLVRHELEVNPALDEITELEVEEEKPESETKSEELDLGELLSGDVQPPAPAGSEDYDPFEFASGPGASLADILVPQAREHLAAEDLPVAEYIIRSLDEDGLLRTPPAEVADALDVEVGRVEYVLERIRRFEPVGVACPDARGALLVQLEAQGFDASSPEWKIVSLYHAQLGKRTPVQLARLLDVSEDRLARALRTLQRLDPRPGHQYAAADATYVQPDFTVRWTGDTLVAGLNDDSLPRLRVGARYREILLNPSSFSAEEVAFARVKVRGALFFIRGIEQRKRTMRRIMDHLMKHQGDFLRRGVECLRPLNMSDTASELGLHPSTISRAIKDKYIETPHGIYGLKYLFSKGPGNAAQARIKERLKQLVESEPPAIPLGDDALARVLSSEGMALSRRTVAKYRSELRIAPQNLRRRTG